MRGLVVIPARGGSKGIPRKNARLMCGKPLIAYSIENARKSRFDLEVVVSTDSEEIARIALSYGARVIKRPEELAADDVTLDPVVYHALGEMEKPENGDYDFVITMQPTSPLLSPVTLDLAIEYFIGHEWDTVISGVNRPRLSWTERDGEIVPLYEKRLNRQHLSKNLVETGAFLISKKRCVKPDSRIGRTVSIYEVPENEAVDIDGPQDWWVAEKELSKKNILIRTDGYGAIGLGHIYRCLILAYHLVEHNIHFVLSSKSDIGIQKIKGSHFPYSVIENDKEMAELIADYKCDILVNDILDTDEAYVMFCKNMGVRVVNIEDLGAGAAYADAVINDLYEAQNNYKNHYWGSDYYCIRDEFVLAKPAGFREKVQEVLVIFGGTDPCNLTQRLFEIIKTLPEENLRYTFIMGLGYKGAGAIEAAVGDSDLRIEVVRDVPLMTAYMRRADIAISSQGRTMIELAAMAVPTILLAQNIREQQHEFGYFKNGFINLGLGREVEDHRIKETLLWLMHSPKIRRQMKEQMLKIDLKKGVRRVVDIILDKNAYG